MIGLLILLLIIGFPAAEIYVMILVGREVGFWNTVFLLFFSGVFGFYIAQAQGQIALQRVQKSLAEGRMPAKETADSILIFAAGVFFILPGFISDVIGLVLLFPPTRWIIRTLFMKGIQSAATSGTGFRFGQGFGGGFTSGFGHPEGGNDASFQDRPSQAKTSAPKSVTRGPIQDAEIIDKS